MNGILVVERKWKTKEKRRSNYRGFDGWYLSESYWEQFELWLMNKDKSFKLNENCLADLSYLKELIEYVDSKNSSNIDILLISEANYINCLDNFIFIGYDYGQISCYDYCYDDKDEFYFSIVINEIHDRAFKNFIPKLNKYYLFSDINDAKKLHKARLKAFKENDINIAFEPAVEPKDCKIYKIYLFTK